MRWALIPATGVAGNGRESRTGTQTRREDEHVKTEAGTGVRQLQVTERPGRWQPPDARQARKDSYR